MNGYGGKIIRLNLSENRVDKFNLDQKLAKEYIGGRGFIAKILYDELPWGVDPLSSENKIVMAAGPLSGVFWPSAAKVVFGTKSPLTGGYSDSNMGGFLMAEMKYAGYDMVIFEGKAKSPCYIFIDDEVVEIRDASKYWGKGVLDVEREMKEDLGEDFQIAAIGPAGENLVKYSNIGHDFGRQAGRCGIGAVFGSKKVKAIAVRGTKDIKIYHIEELTNLSKSALRYIMNHDYFEHFRMYGTTASTDLSLETGFFPTKNFRLDQYEKFEGLRPEFMRKRIWISDKACFACPLSCGNYTHSKKYDTFIDGPEYETIAMFGGSCFLKDIEDVQYINYLCDNYGMDIISTAGTIAFAMECYERGIITEKDTHGIELKFGNFDAIVKIIKKIAYREGIGELLSEGCQNMSEKLGKDSKKFAMHIKGLEFSAHESRGLPAMLLSYMTSDIGAQHTRSWTIVQDLKLGRDSIEGRAKLVKELQTLRPLMEMFGVCRFPWLEVKLDFENYVKVFNAVTGFNYSKDDLFKISERVWTLTRAFWAREVEDFGRKYDLPPERVYEPVPAGVTKGMHLVKEKINQCLDEYYKLRGWNSNGIPTEEKLKEVDLGYVAEDLKKLGKI